MRDTLGSGAPSQLELIDNASLSMESGLVVDQCEMHRSVVGGAYPLDDYVPGEENRHRGRGGAHHGDPVQPVSGTVVVDGDRSVIA